MRAVRYNVAASLDGFIAGPQGEFDWIPADPTVDFAAMFAGVDTVLLGRKSYEHMAGGPTPWDTKTRVYVFSNTLAKLSDPDATLSDDPVGTVDGLRNESGEGEIWLFGGGTLFRCLADAGLVDSVEVTVVPILLGEGIPIIGPANAPVALALDTVQQYPSGMVTLSYSMDSPETAAT